MDDIVEVKLNIMSGSKLQRNGLVTNMARSNAVEYAADFIMSQCLYFKLTEPRFD